MNTSFCSFFSKASLVLAFAVVSLEDVAQAFSPSLALDQMRITWEREAENKIRSLAGGMFPDVQGKHRESPLMVAVVGIPGSGKSCASEILGHFLGDEGCLVFPHDGYHYSIDQLQSMPDPNDVIYRRGAPDTFDAQSLKRDLARIKYSKEDAIRLPDFDHARGDPEPDAHEFNRKNHKIVICEGLYLLHDQDGWDQISDFFDLSIFVDASVDKCMDRLKIRNKCIPGYTPEEIEIRVDKVDRQNAMTVTKSKERAQLVYPSLAL